MNPQASDRWGLRTLMTQTLDPAYAAAARSGRASPSQAHALVLTVVLLVGLVLGVAYRQQQQGATDRQSARAALAERIVERSAQVGELGSTLSALRADVAALRAAALGSSEQGPGLLDPLDEQEMHAGLTPVNGPGVTITVTDPKPGPSNDPVGQTPSQDALVTDVDLQRAVNALWASGAEAIAINGERIGPTTAIRQAGGTVLIDFRPTASPYRIDVIGDPASLPAAFATTEPGRRFSTYRTAYGAGYEVRTADELTLPAASEPVQAGDSSPGGG